MVKMSKMVDYAILILINLSKRNNNKRISAREISEDHNLPFPTVSKILKQLAKENIVISTQGSKGGYMLSENPEEITLKMLIDALDGSSDIITCFSGSSYCDHINNCPAKSSMVFIDSEITRILEKITLKEILLRSKD